MEVDFTEGEDAATETIVSTIKPALAQVDVVTWEDMPSHPEDATGMGAANPSSEMDKDDESRQGDSEMPLTLQRGDRADPITGTGGLKHIMLWGVVREAASAEMAYEELKESLIDLLLELQSRDISTQQQIQRLSEGLTWDAGSIEDTHAEWRVDPNGLLCYKKAIYMPNDPAVK